MAIVPDQSPPSAVDEDFGANDWLLEEMYEQYSADPSSVDETWATYFQTHGAPHEPNGNAAQPARATASRPTPEAEPDAPAQPRRAADRPTTTAAPAPAPAQASPAAQPRPEPAPSRRAPTVEKPSPSKETRPAAPGARG
ncbi:MAG TPA: multifunctional oxoglutarate decarboxylase/oxoglutarate dehydrogenase thiamine pyrophosphate-binding subunit/dihydrolipoyllysine-residue succinyltransferase subunit, partial [Propionibacteriaceae bacterium]|nr:multifunctional oxoglutarate decarboxylase/oxoglutarate dehydrogenase thiamine pyrophosphate-binding subunit/dihydrolipoyllysine-residue succinyltransferase subunit [Propionibacteriaceae bacterium]